jgi:DNA-binding CsgD family transcriptional regulator
MRTLSFEVPSTAPRRSPSSGAKAATKTEREREVLALMAEGRSNKTIAQGLFITEHTVEKHVKSIFGKLRIPATAEDHRRACGPHLLEFVLTAASRTEVSGSPAGGRPDPLRVSQHDLVRSRPPGSPARAKEHGGSGISFGLGS